MAVRTLIGSPTLGASANGCLELFVFDVTSALWHIWQQRAGDSGSWYGWRDQSGSWSDMDSPPVSVFRYLDSTLEILASGTQVYNDCQASPDGDWSNWGLLPLVPNTFPGLGFYPPGVAGSADGRLELFVANGGLWRSEQWPPSSMWSDWQSHGTPENALVVGPVTAAETGDHRIEVFVVDMDGQLWNIRQTTPNGAFSTFNSYANPGVALADRPGLAQSADGRLELFVRGVDGQLYHQWETAVGTLTWSGWTNFNGSLRRDVAIVDHPVVAAGADGRLEIFVTGSDGNVYHSWQTAPSNGWSTPWYSEGSNGGGFASAPCLGRNADGRLEIFAVGNDGNLYHKWQTAPNNGWSAWTLFPAEDTTTVPNVIGMNPQGAEFEVHAANLQAAFPDAPPGSTYVHSQEPVGGTHVGVGSTVTMHLVGGGHEPF